MEYNHKDDWFYEGNVSGKLVEYLNAEGYEIIKDNSKKVTAHGIDVIARQPSGVIELIEVKGYPTIFHTKGANKGEIKVPHPTLQAKHWFSEAILSSMFNYRKYKGKSDFILALAFPSDNDGRYKKLIGKVEDFFTDHKVNFKVYFVCEDGSVKVDNLCKHH